ncbi:hypothetical protein Zmor_009036, partial [Zophobas morio]
AKSEKNTHPNNYRQKKEELKEKNPDIFFYDATVRPTLFIDRLCHDSLEGLKSGNYRAGPRPFRHGGKPPKKNNNERRDSPRHTTQGNPETLASTTASQAPSPSLSPG